MPLVSIIMPVYNTGNVLHSTIKSVFNANIYGFRTSFDR